MAIVVALSWECRSSGQSLSSLRCVLALSSRLTMKPFTSMSPSPCGDVPMGSVLANFISFVLSVVFVCTQRVELLLFVDVRSPNWFHCELGLREEKDILDVVPVVLEFVQERPHFKDLLMCVALAQEQRWFGSGGFQATQRSVIVRCPNNYVVRVFIFLLFLLLPLLVFLIVIRNLRYFLIFVGLYFCRCGLLVIKVVKVSVFLRLLWCTDTI